MHFDLKIIGKERSPGLTLGNGAQYEDARFLDDPVGMEEQGFQEWQQVGQQLISKHVGKHVQCCC